MQPYEALSETEWVEVERIHDLIDQGEFESARMSIDGMLRKRPRHPDLLIVDATLCLEESEPALALDSLRGAERSADPAQFFYLRAAAQYDLVQFAQARADVERAVAIHPAFPHGFDLLSRVLEHSSDAEGAAKAAEQARSLDPEAFPLPLEVDAKSFDLLVERAVQELPAKVREKLEDIPVLVQDLPTPEMLTEEEPALTPDLLGLFVGRHIFAESSSAAPTAPGAIFLFRRNLLRACSDREELENEIRITVQHEVGHLLGLDEDELDEWGLA